MKPFPIDAHTGLYALYPAPRPDEFVFDFSRGQKKSAARSSKKNRTVGNKKK